MGSMVVGVVVSAFLFTPFFVCQEDRCKRLDQMWHPVQLSLRISPKPGPIQGFDTHSDLGLKGNWNGKRLKTGRPCPITLLCS